MSLRRVWDGMRRRCYDPKTRGYHRYGGRGIKVCDEWRNDFMAFAEYVGERPTPAHSIDRIDNDGDYAPGNVRWATRLQQARNRSDVTIVSIDGESLPISVWAERLGMEHVDFYRRYHLLGVDPPAPMIPGERLRAYTYRSCWGVRYVMAARSAFHALQISGRPGNEVMPFETKNHKAVAMALARPGKIFWKTDDEDEYHEIEVTPPDWKAGRQTFLAGGAIGER